MRADELVRPMGPEERGAPCFVRHPDAGGRCPRAAVTRVYGLAFCGVHGAEASAGALGELYDDAASWLERLDSETAPPIPNREADRAIKAAIGALDARQVEANEDEWELLRRAYPTIPERVDTETVEHVYRQRGPTPMDWFLDARRSICGLMREACRQHLTYVVEALEEKRESVSAQAAFAIEDYDRRVGTPE